MHIIHTSSIVIHRLFGMDIMQIGQLMCAWACYAIIIYRMSL